MMMIILVVGKAGHKFVCGEANRSNKPICFRSASDQACPWAFSAAGLRALDGRSKGCIVARSLRKIDMVGVDQTAERSPMIAIRFESMYFVAGVLRRN